jgi:23S rRNA (guanosine2251-2'-O)-methyltransferase
MKKLIHSEILAERLRPDEALAAGRHPVALLLYNVRSLYNVGSVFRTADSALVSELILVGFTPHPPRKEIEKTALGATETVPWKYFKTINEAIDYIRSKNIKLIALELTDKKRSYDSLETGDYPCCLVLGNELTGLDDDVIDACDDAVEIPMYGVKHSLNVSVAAGIAVYEAVRTWRYINNK